MPEHADAWWDELKEEAELPPPPPRSKAPLILGGFAALVASGALAWWLTSSETTFRNPDTLLVRPAPAAVRLASAQPDAEQVRRAYGEFTAVYADSGREGLARFSESCEHSLRGDPRILDFCLAFGMFSDSVAEAPAPQTERVALIQAALPGEAPEQRIEAVKRLMRQISGVPEPPADAPRVEKALEAPAAPVGREGLQKASIPKAAAAPAPKRTARATSRASAIPATCRSRPTAADRLMCADPKLAVQHWRMRQAYDAAVASGIDRLVIDEAQARWRSARDSADTRAEVAAVYARRIRELEAVAAIGKAGSPAS